MGLMVSPVEVWVVSVALIVIAFVLKGKGARIALLVLGLLVSAVQMGWTSFHHGGPWVSIENNSGEPVRSVRVLFEEVSVSMQELDPQNGATSLIYPKPGSPLVLTYQDAGGEEHTADAVLTETPFYGELSIVLRPKGTVEWKKGARPR